MSRKNFVGHITSSIFVVTPDKRVLLFQHEKLEKLLQPGGHVEPKETSILKAAICKLEQEAGLKIADLRYRPLIPGQDDVPFHIDTHHIPEDPRSGEPAHYHHDFQYLALAPKGLSVRFEPVNPRSWRWVDWEDFRQLGTFAVQIPKIEELLNKSPEHFLKEVVGVGNFKKVPVLAVSHILPSMLGPLRFMQNNFDLLGVVVKPKSIDQAIYDQLEQEGIRFLHPDRHEITVEWMSKVLGDTKEVVLSDIGGYFAPVVPYVEKLKTKILAIVEDTENGHQKYEQVLSRAKTPIYSVARSPLKDNEDFLVGHAVAHATDTLLRQNNVLMSYGKCGVIGYGKVGQGICSYLMSMHIKPVVCEINPERLVKAYNHGCDIGEIDDLLKTCDTLFCATGSRSLDIHKFRKVKNGAHIASVTSSDDEFNFEYLKGEYLVGSPSGPFVEVKNAVNTFYLLNGGNAVNFLFNASLGDFIYLVQGEIIKCVTHIMKEQETLDIGRILTLSEPGRQEIAKLWLQEFPIKK